MITAEELKKLPEIVRKQYEQCEKFEKQCQALVNKEQKQYEEFIKRNNNLSPKDFLLKYYFEFGKALSSVRLDEYKSAYCKVHYGEEFVEQLPISNRASIAETLAAADITKQEVKTTFDIKAEVVQEPIVEQIEMNVSVAPKEEKDKHEEETTSSENTECNVNTSCEYIDNTNYEDEFSCKIDVNSDLEEVTDAFFRAIPKCRKPYFTYQEIFEKVFAKSFQPNEEDDNYQFVEDMLVALSRNGIILYRRELKRAKMLENFSRDLVKLSVLKACVLNTLHPEDTPKMPEEFRRRMFVNYGLLLIDKLSNEIRMYHTPVGKVLKQLGLAKGKKQKKEVVE